MILFCHYFGARAAVRGDLPCALKVQLAASSAASGEHCAAYLVSYDRAGVHRAAAYFAIGR